MNTSRLVLRVSALLFYAFGLWAFVAPESMVGLLGIELPVPAARIDVRAFYGGLEIGFGTFLWICSNRPAYAAPAHLAAIFIFGGCCLGRTLAMAWAGYADWLLVLSGLGELGGALVNAYANRNPPSTLPVD